MRMVNKKLIAIGILIAFIVVVFGPVLNTLYVSEWTGGGGGTRHDVAVIYLWNSVMDLKPSTTVDALKKICNSDSGESYSVTNFFKGYGVSLNFRFYAYKVYSSISGAKSGDHYQALVVRSFALERPSTFYSIYDSNDIVIFVVKGKMHADAWGRTSNAGHIIVTDYRDWIIRSPNYARFVIAHELAHIFGGEDHYSYTGGFSQGCHDCVLNQGSNNAFLLLKVKPYRAVFCSIALSELHLSWAKKIPRDYFARGNW